ncbi:MAG: hypothetical protein KAQ83_03170 [Nanoarchaeota archaeon]|nr:hypothetical protein [Nanoarchaeota archaeon]
MEKEQRHQRRGSHESNTIAKETFMGLLAVGLGAYNLLASFGIVTSFVDIPQIVGNIILVVVGFLLWITAFKLYRHKYHTNRLF